MPTILAYLLLLCSSCKGLIHFHEALKDFKMNHKLTHPVAFHLSNELPRTSLLNCQEFPNEGAASCTQFARGPIRTCHMQGVCLNLKESKNIVHLSRYLRQGSQIPSILQGEYYYGTYSGMRATNAATFNLISINEELLRRNNLSVAVIEDPALISRRYMGINTMHVLHDDFLPSLATILQHPLLLKTPAGKRLILAVDEFPADNENSRLMQWLGNFWSLDYLQANVRFRAGMRPDEHLDYLCFEEVVVGADPVSTSWYHYGFHSPQGPIELSQETFEKVASNLKAASAWVKRELNLPIRETRPFTVSIVSRKSTRLILNEEELINFIKEEFPGCLVNLLRAEEASLEELIEAVALTDVLVGMHGALLALIAFLPPGSKLIEMFPYAIPPENYTPFKTLARLLGIEYRTWVNSRSEPPYNIGHPEADYTAGGLKHFPASYAAGIIATTTVPEHLCCYSPFWIYRIFQDTHVDPQAILELIKQ